ncbi:MAG TPA: hypothetical protein VK821_08525 [Dehalococcoidia bacterium]|nr:hypothetical protein [Dehalococcoidia bacterium]
MRYETETKLRPKQVIKLAEDFFGGELGLAECERGDAEAAFEGGGGAVALMAKSAGGSTVVELLSQEWDNQAKSFLRQVKGRRSVRR